MAGTKKKMKTKTIAILVGIGVAVAGGGIAFAFFTNVGAGTGGAAAGSNNPVVVRQTNALTPVAPGVTQTLSGTFDNPNPGPVQIASVTAVVTAVALANPAPTPAPASGCTTADFAITGGNGGLPNKTLVGAAPGTQIPAGTGVGAWSGLTLSFVNTAVNQDGCKNATVTITYTAA